MSTLDLQWIKTHPCEFPGAEHDEAFGCDHCEKRVCGMCATTNGSNWLCPDEEETQ